MCGRGAWGCAEEDVGSAAVRVVCGYVKGGDGLAVQQLWVVVERDRYAFKQ